MLGFHVVARLAARYGITVNVAPTPGGGLTALVWLPGDLVSERSIAAPVAGAEHPGQRRRILDVGLRLAGRVAPAFRGGQRRPARRAVAAAGPAPVAARLEPPAPPAPVPVARHAHGRRRGPDGLGPRAPHPGRAPRAGPPQRHVLAGDARGRAPGSRPSRRPRRLGITRALG